MLTIQIYTCDESFVFGINGGKFGDFSSEPIALILRNKPVLLRSWKTPNETEQNPFTSQLWEYEYEFREYLCDQKRVYILCIDYMRIEPSFARGRAEFILEESYVLEKLEELNNRENITEINWLEKKRKE